MKNILLIGTGRWARKITDTLRTLGNNVQIKAACNRSLDRPSWLTDIPMYSDVLKAMQHPDITHIIDATGDQDVHDALSYTRLPCWLEKPKKIYAYSFIDYTSLYSPGLTYLRQQLPYLECQTVYSTVTTGVNDARDHLFHDLSIIAKLYPEARLWHVDDLSAGRVRLHFHEPERCIQVDIESQSALQTNRWLTLMGDKNIYRVDLTRHSVYKNSDVIYTASANKPLTLALEAFLSGKHADPGVYARIISWQNEIKGMYDASKSVYAMQVA